MASTLEPLDGSQASAIGKAAAIGGIPATKGVRLGGGFEVKLVS